jgi:peptide/nickel transport system substrate-binding protein
MTGGGTIRFGTWKAVAVVVGVLVVGTAVAAAAPLGPSVRRATDRQIVVGHLFAIDSLNPFIGFSNEAYLFYALVYDFLFSLDEDQDYVPNIALSASTPDGGRTWVYQIRQGVKWHDGTDLTAEDVAFTVNYNIQAFYLLWAYEPYLNQVTQCAPGQTTGCGAKVTAPWEVTVYFDIPFSPGGTAMVFPIIQRAQWRNITPSQAQYSYPNANPIGTGPFEADPGIYQAWLNGDPLILHANPDYHFGRPNVDRIAFQHFNDENSMVASLVRGEIDAAMLSASGYEAVRAAKTSQNLPIELQEGITVIHYWIDIGITQLNHPGVNQVRNPARFDRNVRQAMALATDKDFIVQNFYNGKGEVGTTLVSPVAPFWHYEPTPAESLSYNLSRANALLDAAGYDTRGPNNVRLASRDIALDVYCSEQNLAKGCAENITVPTGTPLRFNMVTRQEAPEEAAIAQYLKENWAAVGMELTYEVMEEFAMNNAVYGGDFDTYIWWWSADADPNYILSIQSNYTLNGWNDNYFDNEAYNVAYLNQLKAQDRDVRRQHVHDAQRVEYLESPFILLVYPYFEYAYWTDEFSGWGDMNAHPGRQIGAFWGKHPLFLELEPLEGTGGPVLPLSVGVVAGGATALVVAIAVYVLVRRRKQRSEEALPEIPPVPPPPG